MTAPATPHIAHYRRWLSERHGQDFADYEALRQWSVREIDAFWQSIWDYFELRSPTPHAAVLAQRKMPGAVWFPGAQVNYARQVLRHVEAAHAANMPAIVSGDESGALKETSWPELRRQAAALAIHLKAHGVGAGDRVAAYLPNVPETIIAFLATASIGAIWSVCAPDMAAPAVIDRFKQIEPKVLIACDGVTYAGRKHDRRQVIDELRRSLPTVEHVVIHGERSARNLRSAAFGHPVRDRAGGRRLRARMAAVRSSALDRLFQRHHRASQADRPRPWRRYPGGAAAERAAQRYRLQLPPEFARRTLHWYSSTGWIMWNCQIAGLLNGTTICIFDGSPGGSKEKPDWTVLWRFVSETKATIFGAGAAYFANCTKAGIDLARVGDLSRLRTLGSTGSPLSADTQQWFNERFARLATTNGNSEQADMFWANMSGGTDFAGAFIGANRELPQTPGLMQCRLLGAAVEAFDERGRPVIEEVGELVCTEPLPSMPLRFWNDEGDARYRDSYFETYPDNYDGTGRGAVWRHGDWLKINTDGSCVIYGRSDATINRHGLRMERARSIRRSKRCRRYWIRWWSTSNISDGKATCRCSWCCARASRSTTRSRRGSTRPSRLACPAAFSPARSSPFPKFRERCRARSRNCRSRNCCSAMPSRRSSTAMRWPIPAVSTGISNSRGTRSGRRKKPARLEAESLRQS